MYREKYIAILKLETIRGANEALPKECLELNIAEYLHNEGTAPQYKDKSEYRKAHDKVTKNIFKLVEMNEVDFDEHSTLGEVVNEIMQNLSSSEKMGLVLSYN